MKRKWKVAKFSTETKEEIYNRDWCCIITWDPITDYHHVFFWAHQANYWPNRNNADQWVWLSADAHRIIHHPSPKETDKAKEYREKCIDYINNL